MDEQEQEIQEFGAMRQSPLYFIQRVWGLFPQPLLPEYERQYQDGLTLKGEEWRTFCASVRPEWFDVYREGKHVTWQQTLVFRGVEKALRGELHPRISIASGHGCHAKGTEILLHDGTTRRVEDIKSGDLLMGDDSSPRTVLRLCRGREQMYRVRYSDNSFYDVNESHILSLVASQSHGKQRRGDITNIPLHDYLNWSERRRRTNIGYKCAIEFDERALPIDPYLLGLWLGDGTSDRGDITNMDSEIISLLEGKHGGVICAKRGDAKTIKVPGLLSLLRSLGVRNNKHIPYEYKTSSKEQRLNLLAGIIDTDGYCAGDEGFEIMQKNKQLAEDIVYIARSVGCHATIRAVQKTCTNGSAGRVTGTYWKMNISRNIWTIPTRIDRKRVTKPSRPQRERLHFGFTIEKLDVDDYYGFELDGNKLFLLGDFTVTHNTGKSTMLSWIILWFLFVHPDSQVPCTAPTASGLFDVLWKEIHKWLAKMPPKIGELYEWQTTHIRMREHPEIWFARAKTSSKENTEALAGVHADWVMPIVDEASGVEEAIFETMEGSLTSGKILVFLVGNGTRSLGYFFDSHHKDKARWQTYTFDSTESPRVDKKFIDGIVAKYGNDSVQYAIRVQGKFPDEGIMDDKGYVQMFTLSDIHFVRYDPYWTPIGHAIGALDASGEGQDITAWAVRDRQRAAIVAEEELSSPAGMAIRSITLMDKFRVKPEDFIIDAFGAGHAVSQEIALATSRQETPWRVIPINSGEPCEDEDDRDQFMNKRAEGYYKMLKWMRSGGEIMESDRLKDELLSIRFRRTQNGRVQIMSKLEMKRLGFPSPDKADALSYTFLIKDETFSREELLAVIDARHGRALLVRDSAGME